MPSTTLPDLIAALYAEIGRCQRQMVEDQKVGNDAHVSHLRSMTQAYRNVLKTVDDETMAGAPRDDFGAGIDLLWASR